MRKTKPRRRTVQLSEGQLQQLRSDRQRIAKEMPSLAAKHERICEAAEERNTSGALRRAIHSSRILLHDLATRAETDVDTLDAFLTGERPLTSDVIDRLTTILKLKLQAVNGERKRRSAKAG
jgi:hypothetical protein